MKITVYTITDCEFSREEKEYLASHQLQFEEKNLETNKEFLTEMLVVSNNFAGTPVTKIEKDDGKIEVLKGFTKDEFDKTLGFAKEKKEEPPNPSTPVAQPTNPTDSNRPADTSAGPIPTDSTIPDPLNSILQDLQAKSVAANPTPVAAPSVPEPTPQTPPSAPTNSGSAGLPSVPDFQK